MKYDFIKVGATVCWHDPEGISEGEYKVASVPDLRFNIIGYGKT